MNCRFPRLTSGKARIIVAQRAGLSLEALIAQVALVPDLARESFAATGVSKVSLPELLALRAQMEDAAKAAGFPTGSAASRQRFDQLIAVMLATLELPEGEMLRRDVWTWLAVQLVPHLVHWRWAKEGKDVAEERYSGILQRNAIGRLWLRGRVFDRGASSDARWDLVNSISEDALLAILERTSIASDWRLARMAGEAWITARKAGRSDRELRNPIIRLRIEHVLTETGVYSDAALGQFIQKQFAARDGLQDAT